MRPNPFGKPVAATGARLGAKRWRTLQLVRSPAQAASGVESVALTDQRRPGLSDGCATESLQATHRLLGLSDFRAKVFALATQSAMEIRTSGRRHSSVPALGQFLTLVTGS